MSYLETNLLPLILNIKTSSTDSLIMQSAGLEDKNSQNGVLIQVGYKLEDFWNKVISDCTNNLIENDNIISVGNKSYRLDHLFDNGSAIYYFKSACNVNFDSEKRPASNNKIQAVSAELEDKYQKQVKTGYFIPCIREVPEKIQKGYPNLNVYGVEWMMNTLKCNLFTVDEFFEFFREVVGSILEEKLYA
jgi:hypothetical protein